MIHWWAGLIAAWLAFLAGYLGGMAREAGRKADTFQKNTGSSSIDDVVQELQEAQDEEDRIRGQMMRIHNAVNR